MNTLLYSVTVSRLINAERNVVFEAFSSAEMLSQWFSPSPEISIELLEFEFVPQGVFRMRYAMPDGTQPIVGGRYEIIEKPTQIIFSWIWEAPDPHADIPTRVVVQFDAKGVNTEITVTHDRLPTKGACSRYVAGWEGTLERLEQLILTVEITHLQTGTDHNV